MLAAVFRAPFDIQVEEVPDPTIEMPTDAIVQVSHACICGTDLWAYKGQSGWQAGQRMGHEFIGTVVEVGPAVRTIKAGDTVVSPFVWSDGVCDFCWEGLQTSCVNGSMWGGPGADGGQGEALRVPFADGTLVRLPSGLDDQELVKVLPLADVMSTGHHGVLSTGTGPGTTIAIVGDGAVGLCSILAAKRLGAERIIVLGSHADRLAIAVRFGATDVLTARDEEAAALVRDLTRGQGAHVVIEAVGTEQAVRTSILITRDGGSVGLLGQPHGAAAGVELLDMFNRNVSIRAGVAPTRKYIPELLEDVLAGRLDASPVFDRRVGLADVPAGYEAMTNRTALKVMADLRQRTETPTGGQWVDAQRIPNKSGWSVGISVA